MDARRVVLSALAVALLCSCSTVAQQGFTPSALASTPVRLLAPASPDRKAGKGLKQHDLLYVSNANGTVNVYRFWQRTLAQVLTRFTQPMGQCTDGSNDVYITDKGSDEIFEYAHGGTKPIQTLGESPYEPYDCADSISNGNLAVANFGQGYYDYKPGTLVVYPHGSGQPVSYQGYSTDHFVNCAYDDRGDLLAVSKNYYYYYIFFNYDFYYLPKHGTKLISMSIPGPSSSGEWGGIGGVAWDGRYWVIASRGKLYRYTINIKAKLVDTIQLSGGYGNFGAIAFYRKTPTSKASEIVGTTSSFSNKSSVEFWNYPAGGNPIGAITKDLDSPVGIAISRRTQ